MSLADLPALANHLWQSTLFVAVVGLLALLMKRNQAQVRHWLWLAASVKFLVPFATLVAVGGQFGWQSAVGVVQPDLTFVIDSISQPFSRPEVTAFSRTATSSAAVLPILLSAIWFCGCAMHLLAWWVRWRRVAVVVREASPLKDGRELHALRRLEKIVGTRRSLAIVISDTSLEPGVFGILKPVLVWPRSITERLADHQLDAILTHELCHVRRRDNLAVAVHMVVEALFWFHPLVWWLEKRLVDERERACDEAVIGLGSEPQSYAESILKTCEFYVGSPLIVAGVTGSDLKKRVEAIMRGHTGQRLEPWRKILLSTVGIATVGAPVVIGVLNTPPLRAQSSATPDKNAQAFEVASIKPNKGDGGTESSMQPGGRLTMINVPLRMLISSAYQVQGEQIVDAPKWINTEHFDVIAKAATEITRGTPGNPGPLPSMMRSLLIERFKLAVHRETREFPAYALQLARRDGKLGPQLHPSTVDCAAIAAARGGSAGPRPSGTDRPQCGIRAAGGHMMAGGLPLSQLASLLSSMVQRVVIDKTGLMGNFDFELKWTPDRTPSGTAASVAPSDPDAPSIFTALQEQLGLKLESAKNPVEVLVVDHVERPTPN